MDKTFFKVFFSLGGMRHFLGFVFSLGWDKIFFKVFFSLGGMRHFLGFFFA